MRISIQNWQKLFAATAAEWQKMTSKILIINHFKNTFFNFLLHIYTLYIFKYTTIKKRNILVINTYFLQQNKNRLYFGHLASIPSWNLYTYANNIFKQFPITSSETCWGVLYIWTLFKNKFAIIKSLTVLKKLVVKITGGKKKNGFLRLLLWRPLKKLYGFLRYSHFLNSIIYSNKKL
jgi:hypothetical protein